MIEMPTTLPEQRHNNGVRLTVVHLDRRILVL